MKVVVAKMHPEKREAILEEVEFDGSLEGLYNLFGLEKYEESIEFEDGLHTSTATDLIITEDHVYLASDCDKWRGGSWKINNMVIGDGYKIAFVGFANVVERKPLLTMEYLKSTIMYPSRENPDMLTEEELELDKQYDN